MEEDIPNTIPQYVAKNCVWRHAGHAPYYNKVNHSCKA
jgi:hypothetical protein